MGETKARADAYARFGLDNRWGRATEPEQQEIVNEWTCAAAKLGAPETEATSDRG